MYYKRTKFKQNRWSHFWENRNLKFFFLCELPLILRVIRKGKEKAQDICKGTPDIEFEQYWSVGLGAILANGKKIKKLFF